MGASGGGDDLGTVKVKDSVKTLVDVSTPALTKSRSRQVLRQLAREKRKWKIRCFDGMRFKVLKVEN